jgi:hypothetical protein
MREEEEGGCFSKTSPDREKGSFLIMYQKRFLPVEKNNHPPSLKLSFKIWYKSLVS